MSPPDVKNRSILLVGACMVIARAGAAQTLDLSGGGVEPPSVSGASFASAQIGVLEKEIAALIAAQRAADATHDVVLRASINLRIIAADMLAAGDSAVPPSAGHVLVIAGLTLAQGADEIDLSLSKLVELRDRAASSPEAVSEQDGRKFRVATMALRRFNELAVQRAQDVKQINVRSFDASLGEILSPLCEAIAVLDGSRIASHWISERDLGADGGIEHDAPPNGFQKTIIPEFGGAAGVPMSDAAQLAMQRLIERMKVAGAIDRLPNDERVGQLQRAVTFAEALCEAFWLSEPDQEMYMQRLEQALLLCIEETTRERGERQISRLESSRRMMTVITELSRRGMDPTPLRDAMLSADALNDHPQEASRGEQLLDRLRLVAQRMLEYRSMDAASSAIELAPVRRQLDSKYREAEQALLEQIVEIAVDDEALARPQFSSLVMNQQQYLEDLQRMENVPRWIDTVKLIRPQSAQVFVNQARRVCQWLLDVNRRPDAVLAMNQLAQQFDLFYPLPLESELRAGGAFVIEATGAQHRQLAQTIDLQRQRWIAALGRGDASAEDANRMLLLWRLMRTMSDLEAIGEIGAHGSSLNRWPAWELLDDVVARAVADLPTRLKLAVAAAVSGEDAALREQLDRIDLAAPLVKLAGRLSSSGTVALAALPNGAAGVLGQLASIPGDDAWMIGQRMHIAGVCRYAMELEHARLRGDQRLAEALTAYVNALADDLLEILGERRDPLPTLIGFDGEATPLK